MRFRILCIALSIMIGVLFAMPITYANEIDNPNRRLTIAGDKSFPPYEYVDDEGEYRGFNVDLMRALSIEMGIEFRLLPMDWVEAYQALENGSIDAIQGISFEGSREGVFEFSTPYLKNSITTFVRSDNTYAVHLTDLKGKRVGVQRSDRAAYILAEIGEIELVFFSDLNQAMVKLIKNDIDAVVGDRLSGMYTIQKYRLQDRIKIIGDEYEASDYGMAVRKGNQELITLLNTGLESLKASGTYDKIYEKWFGKEVVAISDSFKYAFYILVGIAGVFSTVLIFIYSWNQRLKSEVEQRTSELKSAQRVLRESDQFKRQVMEHMGNGLMTFDQDLVLTSFNQDAAALLCKDGMCGGGEMTIGVALEDLFLEKYFDLNKIKQSAQAGISYSLLESTFNSKGRDVVLSYTLSPLLSEESGHLGCVLTFRNITEITTLRAKVAQQDKFEALGRMLSGVAHEIRNPLMAIKTYLDLLPTKYDSPAFREKIVDQVPSEISRLNQLLTELLDYSKSKNVQPQRFRISELISHIVSIVSPEFEKRQIQLDLRLRENDCIYADRSHLKQIMFNLLLNGMEAIDTHGVITIESSSENSLVKVVVSDTGPGIPESIQNSIFEPFFSTKEKGTGLGLALVYQYVRENDGQIDVNSQPGQGTAFIMTFPACRNEGL
ncbi:transporter substrate-binding domain-containing protein [Acidaminobacter hydrogenoformans]|uniref:histidine kinase n=1 Tax=Acidaminobacter hydrogenoformans DSM 2784 TaxID=1120920 RepID=A0A1G5S6M4_9FIRM|nr:transporter substrate-binding domain-containing protein [Acidaminobacter hydrogenoformans]SCZ81757.1 Signal transduction histidine kinase, nitrogen specific [Acidaminobacter hydrogenoformans DSM 2784]